MCEEGGTEAVVDIDDGDSRGAGGEHGVEGRFAFFGRAIARGGGDGDDGAGEEAAENAGERAFHARDGDDGGGVVEGVEVGEDAVDSGDPNVGDLDEGMFEELQGECGLIGDGEVGGSGGDNGDVGPSVFFFFFGEGNTEAASGVVIVEMLVGLGS